MRSSLGAELWGSFAVSRLFAGGVIACGVFACSSGAPPWPAVAGSTGGSDPAAMPSPSAGSAGAARDAGAGGAAGGGGAPTTSAGSAGASAGSPLDSDASAPPMGALCEQSLQTIEQPPTVIVVADRSGSMFNPLDDTNVTPWAQLRATVLGLVLALEGEVRFGFTAYSGDTAACPELDSLPPALGNRAAIEALYGSLETAVRRNGGPAGALADAASVLAAASGTRHVWLVSDGTVDYCDDGNPLCPVDSTIGQLQRLATANPPIRTSVFGVAPATSILPSSALAAFANAGAAEPVTRPAQSQQPTDANAIFDQCSAVAGWASDFANTGKPAMRGQSIADYSTSAGTAVVHAPASDVAALLAELRPELSAERPCSFDLAAAGVTAGALASLNENAEVELGGTRVDNDEQNGWHLVAGASLVLEGASCSALRAASEPPSLQLRWACTP